VLYSGCSSDARLASATALYWGRADDHGGAIVLASDFFGAPCGRPLS
jgi:hypothetical protein